MTKKRTSKTASRKIQRAARAIETAVQAIREVTVDDLLFEDCPATAASDPLDALRDHAAALNVIRDSLFTGFLKGDSLSTKDRELVAEGLNYLETNGAPGLSMRGGTQRMESALERITNALHL